MGRTVAGLLEIIAGLILAAVARPLGEGISDSRDDFWRKFGKFGEWFIYTAKERRAARWWGVIVGGIFVLWGLQTLFGILNFL